MDVLYNKVMTPESTDPPLPSFISNQISQGKYNFIDLQPHSDAKLTVVCVGLEQTAEKYAFQRDNYRYYAIEFISSGHWKLRTDSGEWDLRPGSVYCYGPDSCYNIEQVGSGEHRKYFLNFTGTEAHKRLLDSGLTTDKPRRLIQSRWVQNLFEQLLDTSRLPHSSQNQISKSILSLILERLPHDLASDYIETSQAKINYERCRQFITQHYLEYSQI